MTTPEFEKAYQALNSEQRKAVDTIDGPVMVIAGPGTGKTQVLALRVGNILKETDVAPGNILCLTFTDAAAVNMRERLSALIGSAGYKVAVHTFHGFASDVIASYPEYFYDGANFSPADEIARLDILEGIFRDLPRSNPLSSRHEEEFTYLRDAKRSIGLLKQAGLTPKAFERIIDANEQILPSIGKELSTVLGDRLSKGALSAVASVAKNIATMDKGKGEDGFMSLSATVALSLSRALSDAESTGKTTPLSAWKTKWLPKGEGEERVFKDFEYLPKMRALADVYKAYQGAMHRAKLFDFDDMLLDVLEVLTSRPGLSSLLEERYQYVLVDEFQDTNDAQLKLVRLLGASPVHEGKPNIMIVGDDDQAIYRFQGAEISNIRDFPKMYAKHELVVLTKNYRSTQPILDVAREVIEKSEERLEKLIPTLEKKLVSMNPALGEGHIVHQTLSTPAHEYAYMAKEIGKLIDDGADPREIAIITRRHRELEEIARVLVSANIPIVYERKQNVFEEPHIRAILLLARFITSLMDHDGKVADELMPEILSAPFWRIAREDVWRIARAAGERRDRSWLLAMEKDENRQVVDIAKWLIGLGVRAKSEPLERMLDEIIGSDGFQLPGTDAEDHDEDISARPNKGKVKARFKSPLREYYFGADARKRAEAKYLLFLSSLRVFIGALREFRHGSQLFLADMVAFADMHERNDISLSDTTPFRSAQGAVNLMTAHKAKGLEFDTVFVASCQEEVWAGRGYPNKLPFPVNLRIDHEEGGDDRLRIFYVALTRAKRRLYVTSYAQASSGKASMKTSFISADKSNGAIATHLLGRSPALDDSELVSSIEVLPMHPEFFPIIPGERAILMELIRDYRMSVTHLNNFLNVADGGPSAFLEQNLLRFPQAMRPSGVYGSAMHKAIECFYRDHAETGKLPPKGKLVGYFSEEMSRARLPESERLHFLHAGEEALPIWWEERGKHIARSHRSEVDFKGQGVVVRGVPLSGKIDKMVVEGEKVHVYDFKTGKAKHRWEGKDARERITLHSYQRQLMFYKLLVEHSHDFSKYTVDEGTLEFIEPVEGKIAELSMVITKEDTERLAKLASAVHKRILALDFPDISQYSKDIEGIRAFEEDLLKTEE
jgi:DNA helicase-2/ATP-dependent DNA helicase PcrA